MNVNPPPNPEDLPPRRSEHSAEARLRPPPLPGISPLRERPASLTGVDRGMEEVRNLMFIDGRHHAEARVWVRQRYPLVPEDEHNLLLHGFYLQGVRDGGRLPREAWDYFNRAVNFVREHAASGELLTVNRILTINSLLITGRIPENPRSMVRGPYDVMGVERSSEELRFVFDEEGYYRSRGPHPPIEGFLDRRLLYHRVQLHGERDLPPRSVADLLLELRNQHPPAGRVRQIRKQLRARLERTPHAVAGDQTLIIFGIDPLEGLGYLQRVIGCYHRTVGDIVRGKRGEPGTREYVSAVCALGVITGSLVDMGHFSMDGMGRTNVRIENWIQLQFGLEPPAVVNVVFNGRGYENGSYVPKGVRVAELVRLHRSADPDRCRQALERTKASFEQAGKKRS